MQKNKFKIHINEFLLFRQSTNEIEVIASEIAKIIAGKKIENFLDIGSGCGDLTAEVAKRLKIKNTIAIERESFSKKNNKNIKFLKNDWLVFKNFEKFDFILSAHSMSYLSFGEARKAVKKIYDSLNDGGLAIIIIYDNTGSWPAFKRIFYPVNKIKICTLDILRTILKGYNYKEKVFFTKIYAKNLGDMLKIGCFLGEKHIAEYLKNKDRVSIFFQKFQDKKRIIFPLKHRLLILHK